MDHRVHYKLSFGLEEVRFCSVDLSYSPEVPRFFSQYWRVINKIGTNWVALHSHKVGTGQVLTLEHFFEVVNQ